MLPSSHDSRRDHSGAERGRCDCLVCRVGVRRGRRRSAGRRRWEHGRHGRHREMRGCTHRELAPGSRTPDECGSLVFPQRRSCLSSRGLVAARRRVRAGNAGRQRRARVRRLRDFISRARLAAARGGATHQRANEDHGRAVGRSGAVHRPAAVRVHRRIRRHADPRGLRIRQADAAAHRARDPARASDDLGPSISRKGSRGHSRDELENHRGVRDGRAARSSRSDVPLTTRRRRHRLSSASPSWHAARDRESR